MIIKKYATSTEWTTYSLSSGTDAGLWTISDTSYETGQTADYFGNFVDVTQPESEPIRRKQVFDVVKKQVPVRCDWMARRKTDRHDHRLNWNRVR